MRNGSGHLLTVAASLAVGACGSGPTGTSRNIVPLFSDPAAPVSYTLEDPDCLAGTESVTLTKTRIQAWEGDQVVTRDVDLTNVVTTEKSLTSPVVRMTTFNDQFERVCDLDRGVDHACDEPDGSGQKAWHTDEQPLLRVCKDDHAYGRETYEGVALTSLSYIEQANARYMKLAEASRPLGTLALSVLPHFIDYYDNYIHDRQIKRLKTWMTHNLAYFEGGMIAVFPENVVKREGAKGFFWESAFVLAHEFGHHIDWSRHGNALRVAGLEWNALTHSFDDLMTARDGQGLRSARGQLVGAVSEAYADMLAFYAEGGTALSLIGLPELGIDRNVGGSHFASGDAKVLTDDRLSLLLTGKVPEEASDKPYTQIHVIGAILAHALDQVFTTLAHADANVIPGSEIDLARRYQLTLGWMDALIHELPGSTAPDAMPLPLARALERTVEAHLTKFPLTDGDSPTSAAVKAEVCKQVATLLPALETPPFSLADGQCGQE